jgi:pyruvate,orthophosphate dikinase
MASRISNIDDAGSRPPKCRISRFLDFGFVPKYVVTQVCTDFFHYKDLPPGLKDEYMVALATVEDDIGRKFGDHQDPLLLSVRSGAAQSMPGMMDTVLNLGINDDIVEGMIATSGNARWAYDTYRRFIQMFSDGECLP